MRRFVLAAVFFLSLASTGLCADRSFIWVGNIGLQFTAEQYDYIASHYSYVFFAKFHARWNMTKHHEAARELKLRNPSIKVFPYFSASTWFDGYTFGRNRFKEEWYLHDFQGQKVVHVPDGVGNYYVDVTNPEYRAFALDILGSWMSLTLPDGSPLYDGILFDGSALYNTDVEPGELVDIRLQRLLDAIGLDGVIARNEGTKQLFREARERFPDKLILFNGIAQVTWKDNRGLALLDYADGAIDEYFCFAGNRYMIEPMIMTNVKLMLDPAYAGKMFFQKANFVAGTITDEKRDQLRRFAYGIFLLGHQPGRTFVKYAENGPSLQEMFYSTGGELQNKNGVDLNPKELRLDFGAPVGNYRFERVIYKREFERGWVFVNMRAFPRNHLIREDLVLMNGGVPGQTFHRGDTITIPPHDAAFLMRPQVETLNSGDR